MKENNKLKEDFIEVQEANVELQSIIEENAQERQETKVEMQKVLLQLQDRDRAIQGLLKRVGDLESEKKLMEGRLVALQGKLQPKDEENRRKAEELRNLTAELESLNKLKTDLDLLLTNTRQRQEGLSVQVQQKTVENHEMKTHLSRVITDIHLLNDFILKPEQLKKEVVKLFSK